MLGADVAERVEAVGANVTGFRPGDEVFGDVAPSGFALAHVPDAIRYLEGRHAQGKVVSDIVENG